MSLSIAKIEIKDIGGIKGKFKAELGSTVIVVGENGAGKTSFLSAIQTVLEGGHNPDLIRKGCDYAEILLTLSNGTAICKSIKPTESTLDIRTKDGGIVRAPASYVKSLVPSISFDPIGFLDSDPKDRAGFLLKTLPLTFTADQVNEVIGAPTVSGDVPLVKLNELRDGRYEERAEVNRNVRDWEGTVSVMEGSLPVDDKQDWGTVRDKLADDIGGITQSIETVAAEIALEAEQAKAKKRKEVNDQVAALQDSLNSYVLTVDKTAASMLAEQTRDLEAKRASLSIELGTARSNAEQQQRAAGVRGEIERQREKIRGASAKSERLSEIIKDLDALKIKKLADLPIAGLDISVDKKGKPSIKIDGVPLDQLNRQQQLFIAIRAVSLATGEMPLILCEVAELDDAHLEELRAATEDAGIQLIVARWKNNAPLAVLSEVAA